MERKSIPSPAKFQRTQKRVLIGFQVHVDNIHRQLWQLDHSQSIWMVPSTTCDPLSSRGIGRAAVLPASSMVVQSESALAPGRCPPYPAPLLRCFSWSSRRSVPRGSHIFQAPNVYRGECFSEPTILQKVS